MRPNRRSNANRIAAVIVIVGLILAFTANKSGFNVPLFFVALAFASLIGALGTPNKASILGGLHAFVWLLVVAAFIASGSSIFILFGIAASIFLGIFGRAIMASLFRNNASYNPPAGNRQSTPYYQPSQQAPYQGYEQGYQPEKRETQKETPPVDQYEQPQAHYPQQMPPQQ